MPQPPSTPFNDGDEFQKTPRASQKYNTSHTGNDLDNTPRPPSRWAQNASRVASIETLPPGDTIRTTHRPRMRDGANVSQPLDFHSQAAREGGSPLTSEGSGYMDNSTDPFYIEGNISRLSERLKGSGRKEPQALSKRQRLPITRSRDEHFKPEEGHKLKDTAVQVEMDELLSKPSTLGDLLQAKVMGGPPPYSPEAMVSTREVSNADVSLSDTDRKLELLIHAPNMIPEVAHLFNKVLGGIPLDPSDRWVCAMLGKYHPTFTGQDQIEALKSEADVARLMGDIILNVSVFAKKFFDSADDLKNLSPSSGPEYSEHLKRIFQDTANTVIQSTLLVSSSEPRKVQVKADGSSKETFYKCTPDLIARVVTYTAAHINLLALAVQDSDGRPPPTVSRDIAVMELKTSQTFPGEESSKIRRMVNALKGSKGKSRFTVYRWANEVGQIKNKSDHIISQVRSSTVCSSEAGMTSFYR